MFETGFLRFITIIYVFYTNKTLLSPLKSNEGVFVNYHSRKRSF